MELLVFLRLKEPKFSVSMGNQGYKCVVSIISSGKCLIKGNSAALGGGRRERGRGKTAGLPLNHRFKTKRFSH